MINRIESRSTEGRTDDSKEVMVKRFTVYEESTKPIVEHYRKLGKCVNVDGNREVEEVYSELKKRLLESN